MTQTRLRQEHRQQQTLTPRLQQAVRLLQLSSLDFAQEVSRAMESNPFLEGDEADSESASATPPVAEAREAPPLPRDAVTEAPQITVVDAPPDPQADGEWESSAWAQYGSGSRRGNGSDSEFDSTDLAAADQSLRDHLRAQMQLLPASPRDRALMLTTIEALDDDGYLRIELDELKAIAGVDPAPDDSELLVALRLVQSLEPAGVAARDLKECLLLQLREFQNDECRPQHALATRIVSECLDRVAVRDVTGIAKSLGASTTDVERAFDCIRHLAAPARLALRRIGYPLHHARHHRAQGARRVDGNAEPGHRAARAAQPDVCGSIPQPSRLQPCGSCGSVAGSSLDRTQCRAAFLDNLARRPGNRAEAARVPRLR